jgi:hypothetical protein
MKEVLSYPFLQVFDLYVSYKDDSLLVLILKFLQHESLYQLLDPFVQQKRQSEKYYPQNKYLYTTGRLMNHNSPKISNDFFRFKTLTYEFGNE